MTGIAVCKLMLVVQLALTVASGFVLLGKEDTLKISEEALVSKSNILDNTAQQTTVHHYARHNLCRNFEGKKRLYIAVKSRFCGMSLSFIQNFVMDICRHKKNMLDKLVKELFDIDGNGVISHFEKEYYT